MSGARPRRALVCGASQGIGEATARRLAADGCEVLLLARRAEPLAQLAASLRAQGAQAWPVVADLDQPEALPAALAPFLDHPITVLIHNTGGPAAGPLVNAGPEALSAAFRRHVVSAQVLLTALLPGMRAEGFGRVVTVLSTSVREVLPNLGVSNLTRAAVASWAKSWSRELPPGITINSVLPGYTATPRLEALLNGAAQRAGRPLDEVRAEWLAQVPEGRFADPEETAAAISWLCSPEAAYVRGVALPVDGGRLRTL